jgi:hypothetical protein
MSPETGCARFSSFTSLHRVPRSSPARSMLALNGSSADAQREKASVGGVPQRSKGGGLRAAQPGGHERRHHPPAFHHKRQPRHETQTGDKPHGQSSTGRQDHPRPLDVPQRTRRPAQRHPPGRHRRPQGNRPPLQGTRRRHHRRLRHPLARQRQLPPQLRAALARHLHQQRAAALHQQHGLRHPRQPRARPAAGQGGQRTRRRNPGPPRHHAAPNTAPSCPCAT